MPLSRIRTLFVADPHGHGDRPHTPIPSWLLLPGIATLIAALAAYAQYIRNYQIWGLDLAVYRGGAEAFRAGKPVYELGYTNLELPFTYPPVSLLFFTPLTFVGHRQALFLMLGLSLAATFATAWLTLGMLGYRGTAGRIGVSAALTGLMVWCQPYEHTFNLGQVNVLLMLLIVADLALPDRHRAKGVLIGVAAAIKLVPGIFILYLLLTRRFRAAAGSVGAFLVLTAVGWIAVPGGSATYWLDGLFLRSERVASVVKATYISNQSVHGMAARLFGDGPAMVTVWVLGALVVGVAGMALAVWAHRRGEEAVGMLAVAATGLLLSPIAWSHHWVWIAPLLLVLLDITLRLRGRIQVLAAGLAPAVVFVFLVWPLRDKPTNPLMPRGIIWNAPNFFPDPNDRYTSPLHVVQGELYTFTTLGLFVLAALWLRRARPRRPSLSGEDEPAAAGESDPDLAVRVPAREVVP